MTAIVGHRGKTDKRVDRRRLAPSVCRVHPLARGGFRPKGPRTPTCQAFARWLAARAAVRWSTRRSSRGASAASALRTCVPARSACISIRGRDWNARSPLWREFRPRMRPTNARFFRHAPRGSARPHPPSAASRLSHPARRRRSTTCSSSSPAETTSPRKVRAVGAPAGQNNIALAKRSRRIPSRRFDAELR